MKDYSTIERGKLIEEIYRKEAEIQRLRTALDRRQEFYELRDKIDRLRAALEEIADHEGPAAVTARSVLGTIRKADA
jgi:uncharacterized coiled-coil DUF342 family protein